MDGRKQKPLIPIACRYIPYDRYFLTHGDPAWKVKHLKQRILARALSLPIDVRRLDPDYVYVPPSTSVSRRKTAAKAPSKETFSGAGGDGDDEPWNARREGREGQAQGRRAPSPITFAGADGDRDSDAELGEEYFSAAEVVSGGARDRVASPSGSSSTSAEEDGDGSDDVGRTRKKTKTTTTITTRRRGGSVSPIEFANPIVLRRQKSASMGAFLYEKGVEAGLVMPMPMPKSDKARGKQKAKDPEADAEGGDGDEEGGDDGPAADGEAGDSEEEAGYQVDTDGSEEWSDDYDDEDLGSFVRSPTDSKETKELPAERPETPPPGGRILPGGDGTAVPSGAGPVPGGRIGAGGGGGGGGVHFAAPATPRTGGKNKKRRKGASIVGPLSKIAKTVTGTSSHQHSHSVSSSHSQPRSHSQMVVYGPPPDPSEQILTLPFALVRFSTGQQLEDDLPISWYDLRPYELLEVHFALQPRRFEVSNRLGAILTRTVRGAPFALGGGFLDADDDRNRKHRKNLGDDPFGQLALALEHERERDRPRDGFGNGPGVGAVDVPPRPEMFFHTEARELVSLPRGDLEAYVKPYWEGWARALRVMAPAREFHPYPQAGLGQGRYNGYAPPHGHGANVAKYAAAEHPGAAMMGGGGGAGMAVWDPAMNTYGEEKVREAEVDVDALRGRGRPASPKVGRHQHQHQHPYLNYQQPGLGYGPNANKPMKQKPKLEWRERWVVVRDGYIYLFKNRNDPSPTHQLSLSGLLDLKDADHLANHQNPKERRSRTAHAPGPPQGKTFSPERAQTSHGDERRKRHRRSTSTPRPSTSGIGSGSQEYRSGTSIPGSSGVPPLPHGRVLSPEEAEKKRKLDQDLEALRTWDDLSAFSFGKKEKAKDKDRVKGKEKESERQKLREKRSAGAAGDGDWAEGGRRQKSVDIPRERGKRTSEDREWLVLEREREEAERDPRTYIPVSRDAAEAAGMKIICAKFRYRSNHPLGGSSKPKHWYTNTGPSLAGEPMPDADVTENIRREEQAPVRQAPTHPTQMVTPPQRAPTVPGRQMGMTAAVSGPPLSSSVGRAESIVAGPAAVSSGSKFGLAGLFGKDKDSDDLAARKEKEERKREEKERKAREKEQKQLEKDRKKEDKRKKDEDEFRGISSSSSANILSTHPSALHNASRSNFSSISSTPTIRASEGQSSTNVSSMTLRTDDPPATPKADQSRPQLKISPTSTRHNTWDEELDDYDSDVSFSSPVFAHSSESSDDDDFMLAKDRRGYRYGGYHAPANRKRSVPNVTSPNVTTEESSSGVGASADKGKAKGKEDSSKTVGQDSSTPRPVRPSGENERGERGEWLVLDLGSDSAFTSLLRIFHRQSPSIPSAFLPHSITTTLTSQPEQREPVTSQDEATPSSPIASPESGKDAPQSNASNLSDQDDDAEKPIHPEDLSAFMPHVSNRKAASAPALPYPEWRRELVQYARFAGMREMDRPIHLAYTAWGRDKQANDENTYSQRNKKSDSIWARRTRSSFLRTAERKRFDDEPALAPTASEVAIVLEPQTEDGIEKEEDEGRWKRMSLASHVSTIKAGKSSASGEEAITDPLVALPTDSTDDQSMASVEDIGPVSRPESSSDETDDEVVLEVVTHEGFAYGRRDEDLAVAEALGWVSDDSDEESEFEWAAWVTDLPRQYALSKRIKAVHERQRKLIHPAEQVQNEESAPLSPMMFANPFVPDLAEPVMVYDPPRKSIPRPPTPPPKDPEEERTRYIRDKRRWEPHATSISEPLVHAHPNVSTATLHLHHASPSSSTVNQTRIPSRAPSSSQLSTQRSGNPQPTLSSPSSIDSLTDGQRQPSSRIQGRMPSLNINARQNTRLRLQSNPTSPLDDKFSPTSSGYERETSSQTYPRHRHQRQHSRSVSGGDSIFESDATVEEQDIHTQVYQATSSSRPGGLHHSASMPSTRAASALSGIPRTPQTVTFSSSHNEHDSGLFLPEPSMENMLDDRQPAPNRQPIQLSSSPPSRYAASQSPRHYSGHPPSSPRVPSAKSSSSVLKKRRSDLEKGRGLDPETDVAPPLSPTLSEAGSAFSAMQGNYPTSRGSTSSAFPSGGYSSGSGSNTPLDKARALVRRVRSGSSLGGHEIQTVIEEHPQWDSEAGVQQRDGQVEISSSTGTPHQPKKKKSAIDRLVRGFESSLDFMEGR